MLSMIALVVSLIVREKGFVGFLLEPYMSPYSILNQHFFLGIGQR
jgi:hypothetical protein